MRPTRATVAADLAKLRLEAGEMSGGRCDWPDCDQLAQQLAHIEPRGMGGRRSVHRIANVAALCPTHHDMLDGRARLELAELRTLLAAYLQLERGPREEGGNPYV